MKQGSEKFSPIREEQIVNARLKNGWKHKILAAKAKAKAKAVAKVETEPLYASGTASPILKRETSIEDNGDLGHCF